MNLDKLIEVLKSLRHSPNQNVEMHTPGKYAKQRFKPINSVWVGVSGVIYLSPDESVESVLKKQ